MVACANVVMSVFLIQKWGVVGTALGTLLAVLMGNGLFMNYYYQKHLGLNIKVFWYEMIKWYPYAVALFLLGILELKLIDIRSWGTLVFAVVVYLAGYIVLLLKFGLTREEKTSIAAMIKKLF